MNRASPPSAALAMGGPPPEVRWRRIGSGISIGAGATYPSSLAQQQELAVECEGAASVAFMIGTEVSALIDGDPPFTVGYFVPDSLYDDFPIAAPHLVDLAPAGLEMVNAYELSGSIPGAMHDITSKPRIITVRGVGGTPLPVKAIFPILRCATPASGIFVRARIHHSPWSWPPSS